MSVLMRSRFWLPLLITAGTPLQSHALALLLSGTVALSGYLFAVIAQPEKF
jgi:hypothetical protein